MVSKNELEQLSLEAGKEIGENGANLVEMGETLKRNLEENYPDLTLPPNPDEFLLRFLRGCKFDVLLASKKVSQYFKFLQQLRNIYDVYSSSSLERVVQGGVLSVFKERDSKGRVVILYRQELLPATPDLVEIVTVGLFMIIDYLHRTSVDTQRIGFVLVSDMHSFSLSHCRYLKPRQVVAMVKFVTQSFPARMKGYHIVHNPAVFSYFLAIVKPFLSKKIQRRFHLHGWNSPKLRQFFEPQSLPKCLDGEIDDGEFADEEIFSKLVEEDEYYKDLLKRGYNK